MLFAPNCLPGPSATSEGQILGRISLITWPLLTPQTPINNKMMILWISRYQFRTPFPKSPPESWVLLVSVDVIQGNSQRLKDGAIAASYPCHHVTNVTKFILLEISYLFRKCFQMCKLTRAGEKQKAKQGMLCSDFLRHLVFRSYTLASPLPGTACTAPLTMQVPVVAVASWHLIVSAPSWPLLLRGKGQLLPCGHCGSPQSQQLTLEI